MLDQSSSTSGSDGFPLAQSNSESSGFGAFAPRRFSQDLLSLFNVNPSPTLRDIQQLQIELDHQCFQFARSEISDHHENLQLNTVIELAILLSSPLCRAKYPGTFTYQEVQLRALISALALLHYHHVKSLHSEQWDRMHVAISGFARIVTMQLSKDSTLSEKIQHRPSVYLVQLASQYLRYIDRGDSKLPSIIGPIMRILWGAAAVVSNVRFLKIQTLTC